jgi:hypothetical protein
MIFLSPLVAANQTIKHSTDKKQRSAKKLIAGEYGIPNRAEINPVLHMKTKMKGTAANQAED